MASTPPPKHSNSIEDLFKKQTSSSTKATGSQAGYIAGATSKAVKASKLTTPKKSYEEMSQAERLTEKMSDIRLTELEKIAQDRSIQLSLPYLDLKGFPIAPEVLALIPRDEATRARTVSFLKQGDEIRVATSRPGADASAIAERIARQEGANVQIYFVSDPSMDYALKLYDVLPEIKEVIYGLRIDEAKLASYEKDISNFRDLQEKIRTVSTTDVVTLMIGAALKSDASDIHIEAEEGDVKIRFRLDGLLQDAAKLPRETWKQMISRLKLLSGAKINVEGVPQDGRITIYLTNEKIDIRVSFLPTAYGESIVMRLLRPKSVALEFEKLGIRGAALEHLRREIERPNGMIVTTGPTGSGKTTTLYAILRKLNTADSKIITLEDPIEYKLEGINQSQIDHEKKYDFAKGLRSILRQDPDVVMVGEIRDLETAEISIQAALTGHLVVSTIHTNSASGAIPRFLSMGVKPFLLAPAINAIIGQRLVRRLCETCKKPATLSSEILARVTSELTALPPQPGSPPLDLSHLAFFAPPAGENTCTTCSGLGYKGRIGIYEVMTMTKEIENLILTGNVSEYQMEEIAKKQGMVSMVQDGLLKALDGLTSVDEVLRVAELTVKAETEADEKPDV
jgi:type IV pilus assembly protein PilB